jgi:hypothetical protein
MFSKERKLIFLEARDRAPEAAEQVKGGAEDAKESLEALGKKAVDYAQQLADQIVHKMQDQGLEPATRDKLLALVGKVNELKAEIEIAMEDSRGLTEFQLGGFNKQMDGLSKEFGGAKPAETQPGTKEVAVLSEDETAKEEAKELADCRAEMDKHFKGMITWTGEGEARIVVKNPKGLDSVYLLKSIDPYAAKPFSLIDESMIGLDDTAEQFDSAADMARKILPALSVAVKPKKKKRDSVREYYQKQAAAKRLAEKRAREEQGPESLADNSDPENTQVN